MSRTDDIQQVKISVVVPMYRAAALIGQTMEMVVRQTYRNWELILVDDASGDGTAAAAKEAAERLLGTGGRQIPGQVPETRFDPAEETAAGASAAGEPAEGGPDQSDPSGGRAPERSGIRGCIRILEKADNEGAAAARNTGVMAATGGYLAFLDADDIWFPEKLEKELAFMQEHDAAFACHAYEFGDEEARGTGRVVHVLPCLTYQKALTRTIVFTSTVMFDLGKLTREEILMPHCPSEDTALWWKLMRAGHSCYGLDEVLTIYRRSPGTLSSNKGVAIRRIWYLYREREGLGLVKSLICMAGWAVRATLRRL